jgi:hypothetical protein
MEDLLAMNFPSPPKASEVPFTKCSSIVGMPAKKLMKATRMSWIRSNTPLNTENMTSNPEVMRSMKEANNMVAGNGSVWFARFDEYSIINDIIAQLAAQKNGRCECRMHKEAEMEICNRDFYAEVIETNIL